MVPRSDTPPPTGVRRGQALADTAVVLGCAAAYVVAGTAGVGGAWLIAGVAIVLAAYALLVLARRGESWTDYGLRTDGFRTAAVHVGIPTAVAAAAIVGFALWRGRSLARPELLLMLPLYPLWGIVQQLIFQGLLHRRLLVLVRHRGVALVTTASFFALVHLGSWPLVGLTFAAGLAWSRAFQIWPNVWVLGLSHGVLAALAYPLLLADNPLERM